MQHAAGFHVNTNQPQHHHNAHHHPHHNQHHHTAHGPAALQQQQQQHNVNNNNNVNEIDNLHNGNGIGLGDNAHVPSDMQDSDARLQARDKQQIIAKPLASRPAPFLHHTLNHPHLHSLLAHCRNPYIGGKLVVWEGVACYYIITSMLMLNRNMYTQQFTNKQYTS